MSEWLSIESAPKDGRAVLIYGTRGAMMEPDQVIVQAQWSRGWWSGGAPYYHVTHWQPLPDPPGER